MHRASVPFMQSSPDTKTQSAQIYSFTTVCAAAPHLLYVCRCSSYIICVQVPYIMRKASIWIACNFMYTVQFATYYIAMYVQQRNLTPKNVWQHKSVEVTIRQRFSWAKYHSITSQPPVGQPCKWSRTLCTHPTIWPSRTAQAQLQSLTCHSKINWIAQFLVLQP